VRPRPKVNQVFAFRVGNAGPKNRHLKHIACSASVASLARRLDAGVQRKDSKAAVVYRIRGDHEMAGAVLSRFCFFIVPGQEMTVIRPRFPLISQATKV
jgi:hypothetical protein